ncbi:MAG: hypothetical protein JOZ47_03655 [Kutzneria sp.]|nr:hypothetical protein [Kutzneria sp.]
MRLAIRRPVILLAACAATGALLAGCDTSQGQVGAAAIVGDHIVTLDDVQQQITQELVAEPEARELQKAGKFDQVARLIVQLSVWHELTTQLAAREGIQVDQRQVDRDYAQAGGKGPQFLQEVPLTLNGEQFRRYLWDTAVFTGLGKKYAAKSAVTVDVAVVDDKTTATALARRVAADPGRAGTLLKAAGVGGTTLMDQTLSATNSDPALASLFGVDAGTVVAYQVQNGGAAWLVGYVKARNDNAPAVDPGQGVSPQMLEQQGQLMMGRYAQQIGLKVNPRYGVWDPLNVGLAPSDDETIGLVLAAGSHPENR